jgi:hypothetical protein
VSRAGPDANRLERTRGAVVARRRVEVRVESRLSSPNRFLPPNNVPFNRKFVLSPLVHHSVCSSHLSATAVSSLSPPCSSSRLERAPQPIHPPTSAPLILLFLQDCLHRRFAGLEHWDGGDIDKCVCDKFFEVVGVLNLSKTPSKPRSSTLRSSNTEGAHLLKVQKTAGTRDRCRSERPSYTMSANAR